MEEPVSKLEDDYPYYVFVSDKERNFDPYYGRSRKDAAVLWLVYNDMLLSHGGGTACGHNGFGYNRRGVWQQGWYYRFKNASDAKRFAETFGSITVGEGKPSYRLGDADKSVSEGAMDELRAKLEAERVQTAERHLSPEESAVLREQARAEDEGNP